MKFIKAIITVLVLSFLLSSCSFVKPTVQHDTFAYKTSSPTEANKEDLSLLLTWVGYPYTEVGNYTVIEIKDVLLTKDGFEISKVNYTASINIFLREGKIHYRVYALTVQTHDYKGIPTKTTIKDYDLAKQEIEERIKVLDTLLVKQLQDLK